MLLRKLKSITAVSFLLSVGFLQGCSAGDSQDDSPANFNISGNITGLAGAVTLNINGNLETLTTNGDFTLETVVEEEQNYSITIDSSPVGLNCLVENGTGSAVSNISGVTIVCTGLEGVAYSLNTLDFKSAAPSVLTVAFHLIDRMTGTAIDTLSADNVQDFINVEENGAPISTAESFLEVDKLVGLESKYSLVFAIDISTSISSENLKSVIDSIKSSISDELGNSTLDDNQSVTVYLFDSQVTAIVENEKSLTKIFEALDTVTVGGPSTNLYGAIQQATNVWQNEVSLDLISYGSLILFTDGKDSSSIVSKEDALTASAGKDVYFITVGDSADIDGFKAFTDTKNIFQLSNYQELDTIIVQALAHAKTFEDGLYVLEYATPKRAGTHTLTVSTNDDYNCSTAVSVEEEQQLSDNGSLSECNDSSDFSFDASGFTDVSPTLSISGPLASIKSELNWIADVKWSNQTDDIFWDIDVCLGDATYLISEDTKTATFKRENDGLNLIYVSATDNKTGTNVIKTLKLSNDASDFTIRLGASIETLCNR